MIPSNTPVVLGIDVQTGQKVLLALVDRFNGLYCTGKTGSGKSTFLDNMALQDAQNGLGICFISPVSDPIDDLIARLPSHREGHVIKLDLSDNEYTFGLNLFECDNRNEYECSKTKDTVLELWGKLYTESGNLADAPMMHETMLAVSLLLIYNQSYTLAEVPLILSNKDVALKLAQNLPPSQLAIKNWWVDLFNLKEVDKENKIGSTKRRLMDFLTDMTSRRIFGQQTTIDFKKIMDSQPGKILLVQLDPQRPVLSSLVGTTIVSRIAMAAYSRSSIHESQRIPFALYCDEFQRFATSTFSQLLSECRKFKVATFVAHQFRDQLNYLNKGATLNAGSLVVFQVSGADAEVLAPEFSVQQASPPNEQKILSASIVPTLLREGHPDRHVVEFIQKYLRQLAEARADEVDEVSMGRFSPRVSIRPVMRVTTPNLPKPFLYCFDPQSVKTAIVKLNDLLYNGLRNGDVFPPVDPGMLSLLAPALCFPNFFKIKYEEPTEQIRKTSQRMKDIYNERKQLIWEPLRQSKGDETKRLLDKEEEYNKRYWEESILFKLDGASYLEDMLVQQKKRYPLGGDVQALGSVYDGVISPAEVPREQSISFIALEMYALEELNHDNFIGSLRLAFYALEKQPLLANGKIYGVETASQRTIADLEKELAKELANPKQPYTARVKVGTQEHTIQALPLPPVPTSGDYLQEKIRRSNQMDGYLRKREDIDRELESRHERLTALSSGSDVLPGTDTQMALIPFPSSLPAQPALPGRTPALSPPPQPRKKVFRRFEGNVEREANLNGSGGYHAVGEVEMVRVPNLNGGGGFTWQPLPKIAQRTFETTQAPHQVAQNGSTSKQTQKQQSSKQSRKRSRQTEDDDA